MLRTELAKQLGRVSLGNLSSGWSKLQVTDATTNHRKIELQIEVTPTKEEVVEKKKQVTKPTNTMDIAEELQPSPELPMSVPPTMIMFDPEPTFEAVLPWCVLRPVTGLRSLLENMNEVPWKLVSRCPTLLKSEEKIHTIMVVHHPYHTTTIAETAGHWIPCDDRKFKIQNKDYTHNW